MCSGSKNPDGPAPVTAKSPSGLSTSDTKKTNASTANITTKRVATKKFLDAILASRELTTALESFLESEFCLENLLFIQKTGSYREEFVAADIDTPEARMYLQELRDEILRDFLLPTSEKEVNIPAKTKRECLTQIDILKTEGLNMERDEYKETGMSVFEASEHHIKTVLVQERIGRFQNTEGFSQLAHAAGLK